MVTSLTIALAISLTGTGDDKVCYKKCTGHTKDVIKKTKIDNSKLNTVQDYVEADYDEDVYEWICQGEAQGFKHSVTNTITCDGTNHEEWEKYGKIGECYVCY
eukprot:COSAG01_NODE_20937_length_926_cov_5.178537_3_plen_103_part_00